MSTEPETLPTTTVRERPTLKVTGLHIRGLRSIAALDLPEDGLAWRGAVPDLMIVGGANGGGKTTLLRFLAKAFESLDAAPVPGPTGNRTHVPLPAELSASEAWVDFHVLVPGFWEETIRFLVGTEEFFQANATGHSFGYLRRGSHIHDVFTSPLVERYALHFPDLPEPRVLLLPSERDLVSSTEPRGVLGSEDRPQKLVLQWKRLWKREDSFEAEWNHARQVHINGQDESGIAPEHPRSFEKYSDALDRFFQGSKRLSWEDARLVVRSRDGSQQTLDELSSGERQIVLILGEIFLNWRPGSLIMIDEPELHLHSSWMTRLWEFLSRWQREQGGQVILATKSTHLFMVSDPGTKVLLSQRTRNG